MTYAQPRLKVVEVIPYGVTPTTVSFLAQDWYPYWFMQVRRTRMDALARLTSKGQVTIPKVVRDALELHEGDQLVFRLERKRAIVAKTPDFIEMAGSVVVPVAKRGTPWNEVLRQTRRVRAEKRR